jgi:hypothetical protein
MLLPTHYFVRLTNEFTEPVPIQDSLGIGAYDYTSMSYTGSNLTRIVYRLGGSGGTVVATLTLTYDGSNNLTSVTKT